MSDDEKKATLPQPPTGSELTPFDASAPLLPGDVYFEDGLMVFTRQYHLRRGYCCNSDCRHCPYR